MHTLGSNLETQNNSDSLNYRLLQLMENRQCGSRVQLRDTGNKSFKAKSSRNGGHRQRKMWLHFSSCGLYFSTQAASCGYPAGLLGIILD